MLKSIIAYLEGVHALVMVDKPARGFLIILAVLEGGVNDNSELRFACNLLLLESVKVIGLNEEDALLIPYR